MNKLDIFKGLDAASQKHEKELVVDFGKDRILNFLGVYFVILLAIITKFSEITGSKITCFPPNVSSTPKLSHAYANTYCWESNTTLINYDSCRNFGDEFINYPNFVKTFIQWLPYGMLFEGFLLAMPSAWWHYRVGARLMGHLKFVRLLVEDACNSVKQIPAGVYKSLPYEKTINKLFADNDDADRFYKACGKGIECIYSSAEEGCAEDDRSGKSCAAKMESLSSKLLSLIAGDTVDQNIFSALCVENLSSFSHYPYVTSIFELLRSQKFNPPDNALPLQSALFRQWCNEDNFRGRVLVRSYVIKQMIRIVLSATIYLVQRLVESGWYYETFQCVVPYQDHACFLCSISRKMEITGFLVVNLFATAAYFVISIYCLTTFSKSSTGYFRSIHNEKTSAMIAAYFKAKQD